MRNHYVPQATRRWMGDQSRMAAMREGLTETVVYLRRDFLGEPLYYRLVTNSISMASTYGGSQRYMGLFAWWPLALHPRPERALLISFGVGVTRARSCSRTPCGRSTSWTRPPTSWS